MKKIFLFSLLLLAAIPGVFAQNNSSKLSIVLKAGKLTVNKKIITKDWSIISAVKILDTAARKISGQYIKHTYDDLGIVLFERAENKFATGELTEFQVFIDATDEAVYTPKEFFEGKLKIEEINIDQNSTVETVKAALKDYIEKEMSEDNIYRFSKEGIYILLRYNEQKKLQKVSFGKEKSS